MIGQCRELLSVGRVCADKKVDGVPFLPGRLVQHGSTPKGDIQKALAKAEAAYLRLENEVANIPAVTVEGMLAKIRCARAWERDDIGSINGGCAEFLPIRFPSAKLGNLFSESSS